MRRIKESLIIIYSLSFFFIFIVPGILPAQNFGLKFSANSDIVSINRDDIPGEWTVEFWVKKTNASGYSTAIDGQSCKITLESWGNNGKVGITQKGVADWAFNYVVPVNQWKHLAFVCNGSTTKLFVNGVFQDEMNNVIDMPLYALGQSGESGKMILDEIRFWTVLRTDQELADFYNQSVDVNSEGLTGYYYLDDQSSTATDLSQSHVNGIINGPVYVTNDNPDFTTTLPDMTFSSISAENYNEYFSLPGSTNQDILKINIVTDGVINPVTFNSITITTEGTDNLNDISFVKIYYTGGNSHFSPDELIDIEQAPVTGEMTFTEDQTLNPGNNFFWVAFDVADNAVVDNKLDATLSFAVINNDTFSPSTTSPSGYRVIKNGIPQMPVARDAIVPKPKEITIDTSQKFIFNQDIKIVVSDSTMPEGVHLSAFLQKATGYSFEVSTTAAPDGNISLSVLDEYNDEIGDEGYILTCNESGVKIEANTLSGIFYGTQTLRQLLPAEIESPTVVTGVTWDIAYTEITDYPRFSWRGLHLDVSRHFFNADFIKKYIDIMAVNKLNRFHWHLTDDQGWRIEIQSKPLLQTISAWRTCNGVTYGGYYTQDEIADIVQYAAERHVMVIPEIEIPGHTIEVLAAYPELSCATATTPYGGPFEVRCAWGVSEHIYCAGKEETFDFIEDVLTEVCELFPSPYIHLGGDEAPKSMWQQCPDCQARMQEQGLANEEELQRYFMERVGNFLITKNKKWIGWSEITYGGVPDSATVMSWLGESSAITAAQQGHDAILSPYSVLYLDAPNSNDPNEPPSIGYAPNTLEKIYFYDPMPDGLSPEEQQFILGPHSCLWTEYISEEDHAEYMILPRIYSLSEIGWYGNGDDFDDFERRIYPMFERLDMMGYNYRPLDFPEGILPSELYTCEDSVVLTLNILGNSFYWNDENNTTGKTITVYNSGTYKCYVDYLGEIKHVTTSITFKNDITQPEVDITGATWNATGNADLYLWYDLDNNLVYTGNSFTPPAGANPNDYQISGTNLVNKKSSVYINGGPDYTEIENSGFLNGTDAFTIEGWLNIHQYSTWDRLFTKRVSNTQRISVEIENGRLYFEIGKGANTYGYTADIINRNEWHHFAFVYDGNGANNQERMQVYLDGVLIPLTYAGVIPSVTSTNSVPFTIGSDEFNPGFEFTEISLWSIALSGEDILQNMNMQLSGDEEGLVYYFKTEGNDDILLNSCTNNNYSATIINFSSSNRNHDYTSVMVYGCESQKWNVGELIIVEENYQNLNLRIAPNPNKGRFSCSFSIPEANKAVVYVYNISGSIVFKKTYHNVEMVNDNYNLGNLQKGTYVLVVDEGLYKERREFVIH
jgi:hexosaminidase